MSAARPVLSTADIRADRSFAKVAIVGLGLIGGSIALAARAALAAPAVIGVDARWCSNAPWLRQLDVAADDLFRRRGATWSSSRRPSARTSAARRAAGRVRGTRW